MSTGASTPAGDSTSRNAIRSRLNESMLVEASAGTGKTRELVSRTVELLAAGAPIEGIVAVTFTHAAAGEMKLRLRQELENARVAADDSVIRSRLSGALHQLEEAFIGTIHSFCARMLRQRPVEAQVDPAFIEMAQAEAKQIFTRVFRQWMEKKLDGNAPGLRRALLRLAHRQDWQSGEPFDILREAAWQLAEWRDFPTPWRHHGIDRAAALQTLMESLPELDGLRARCDRPGRDPLHTSLQRVADLVQAVNSAESAGEAMDLDWLEAAIFLTRATVQRRFRSGHGRFAAGVERDHVVSLMDNAFRAIDEFRVQADAELASLLREELCEVVEAYEQAKKLAGKLDFADLLLRTRDVLRDQPDARAWFQRRYRHIIVDEFQDTDPLQVEILLLLACDDPVQSDWRDVTPGPGRLFLVGDPKQSIYRFRRADAQLYRGIRNSLSTCGVRVETLQASRRSNLALQEFVNAAFADMPDYLPLEGGRDSVPTQPAVVALPVPTPYGGNQKIAKVAINRCCPDTVAAFVEWMLKESGWQVSDPADPKALAPLKAEHICLLFRRFKELDDDHSRGYARALEVRGIRHVLVGSKSFHNREEIETIRAALRAIEWPDDELSVYATLRGSLFAISDATLFQFRRSHNRLHPFHESPSELAPEFGPVREALTALREFHLRRNAVPIATTIHELLDRTRAHAGFAFRKAGEQVLANIYRLADLARSFEGSGGISFRAFIDYLDDEAAAAEASDAPVLEEGGDGVKLMTVHRAKGLEFPVVILADPAANLVPRNGASRHVDTERRLCAQKIMGLAPWELIENQQHEDAQEHEEAVRLAYVAATRARDVLVITAVGDEPLEGGWLSPLYDALYPAHELRRSAMPAPGCPQFGARTVLERPEEFGFEEISVQPGLHRGRAGGCEVVWFDPALLDRKRPDQLGLVNANILKVEGHDSEIEEGLAQYRQWGERRHERIASGSKPRWVVERPTEASGALESGDDIEIIALPRRYDRPGGRDFGAFVHAVLQTVPLDAAPSDVERAARTVARLTGSSDQEIAACTSAVVSALSQPLLCDAAAAARVYREYPVLLQGEGNAIHEGTVDLAFETAEGWTIIDFKTDRADQTRYKRQLAIYRAAFKEITGRPVRTVLLEV